MPRLFLDTEIMSDWAASTINPPVREAKDKAAIWDALQSG